MLNVKDIVNNFNKKVANEHIHVTEEDIDEYMTDLFTDEMETEEDMDAINEAEAWLKNYYGVNEIDDDIDETDWQAEYEAEATERIENRYMNGGNGFTADIKDECTQVSNIGSDKVSVFGSDAGNKFVHPSEIYKELYELNDYNDTENITALTETTKYNTKSRKEYTDIEEYKDAIHDDVSTMTNTIEELKYKMNTDESVEVLNKYIDIIRSDLLNNIYANK